MALMTRFINAWVSRTGSAMTGRQTRFNSRGDFNLPRGGFRPQQFADVRDDFGDFNRLQIHCRRPGQAQKSLHDAFEAMQFAVNDFQPGVQRFPGFGRERGKSSSSNCT